MAAGVLFHYTPKQLSRAVNEIKGGVLSNRFMPRLKMLIGIYLVL
jgi:hypothetical protein